MPLHSLFLLTLIALTLAHLASAHDAPGTLDSNLGCQQSETYHVYYGSLGVRAGIWHVLRPSIAIEVPLDGNINDCNPWGAPAGTGGYGYPYNDPVASSRDLAIGWNDGMPADFDYDAEVGVGGGFFPGGPWATDTDCDYGYTNDHGSRPTITDISYPLLGLIARPAFLWGADDADLGQNGNPYADTFSGKIPTLDPADTPGGANPNADGLTCVTDGLISPEIDPDDWLQFCTGSVTTSCTDGSNTYPDAGGDGGFHAFTLTATTHDLGLTDWIQFPNTSPSLPQLDGYYHEHGHARSFGYHSACDPTLPGYNPTIDSDGDGWIDLFCHSPIDQDGDGTNDIPTEIFITIAGTIHT